MRVGHGVGVRIRTVARVRAAVMGIVMGRVRAAVMGGVMGMVMGRVMGRVRPCIHCSTRPGVLVKPTSRRMRSRQMLAPALIYQCFIYHRWMP